MVTASAAQSRYTAARVLKFLHATEEAYGVSLKFWVEGQKDAGADPDLVIFCWGSGDPFDLIPEGIQPRGMMIYEDEEESIEQALYWSIAAVERLLSRVREPLGPRPVL